MIKYKNLASIFQTYYSLYSLFVYKPAIKSNIRKYTRIFNENKLSGFL